MASRQENCESIVIWGKLRHMWGRQSRGFGVRPFFDKFYQTHRNYQFTVAKVYYGLYEVGITCEQYDELKNEVERQTGQTLPDIMCTELLENSDARQEKFYMSFRDEEEYTSYKSGFVQANNRKIVRETRDEAKAHFKEAERSLMEANGRLIVSFDLEVYEYDHDKVLEIGYIVVRLGSGAPKVAEKCHFIIQENLKYKNKVFVLDNRRGFRFGESKTVPQKEAVEKFRQAVKNSAFLVAHAARHDKSYLKKIGFDLAGLKKGIMDTQLIEQHKEFAATSVIGDRLYIRSLNKLLTEYNVVYRERDLHNAGCDAYYTMKVFLRQMGYTASVVNALA